MKVRFWCDSGANIHSCNKEILDVEEDLDYTIEEWNALTDDEKYKEAERWAWNYLEIGYEELD